ncbi:MAG: FliM/FliN family flagellar motor switch protein [Ignavibacteriota bacterium]
MAKGAQAAEAPAAAASVDLPPEQDTVDVSRRVFNTLDLLLDVEMPVSVSFGRTQVRIQDILKLITGSIIELDRAISEPVEVIVNNCVIARGEVVWWKATTACGSMK